MPPKDPDSDSWIVERSGVLVTLKSHGEKLDNIDCKLDSLLVGHARTDERVKIHAGIWGGLAGVLGSIVASLFRSKTGG